jgi:hypothetical protein
VAALLPQERCVANLTLSHAEILGEQAASLWRMIRSSYMKNDVNDLKSIHGFTTGSQIMPLVLRDTLK